VPLPPSHIVHKPALVITDSSGERGGANANAHIQQLLRYMGMNVRNDFITIGKVQEVFDDQDRLVNQQVAKELNEAMKNFVDMIEPQNN